MQRSQAAAFLAEMKEVTFSPALMSNERVTSMRRHQPWALPTKSLMSLIFSSSRKRFRSSRARGSARGST